MLRRRGSNTGPAVDIRRLGTAGRPAVRRRVNHPPRTITVVIRIVMRTTVIPAPAMPAIVITVIWSRPGPDRNRRVIPHRRVIDYRIIRPYRSIIIRIAERKGDGKRSVTAVVIIPATPVPGIIRIPGIRINRIVKVPHTHRRIRKHSDPCAVGNNWRIKRSTRPERSMHMHTRRGCRHWRRREKEGNTYQRKNDQKFLICGFCFHDDLLFFLYVAEYFFLCSSLIH
jgi:hypothetical protein